MIRNTFIQNMFRMLIAMSLFAATFMFAQPVSAQEIAPNPAAEQYLLNELRATGIVDLQWNFAEGERGVSGDALLAALKDPEVLSKPLIYIANATVTNDLWARDLIVPANLVFAEVEFAGFANFASTQLQSFEAYDSTFMGDIDFSDASVSRQVSFVRNTVNGTVYFGTSEIDGYANITNNTFKGSVSFLRSTLNGNVDLRDNVISESLNLYGAHVAGELLLDGSKILGTQAMPGSSSPTEVWNTTVDGLASFDNVEFTGDAKFFGSHFSKLEVIGAVFNSSVDFGEAAVDQIANFDSTNFTSDADFTNFSTGSDANFRSASFNGAAVFENVSVGRDGNFQSATFNGIANFDYFTAERFVDFSWTTFNQDFKFYYTEVAYPYFYNTVFNGPVTFEGMQASQAFEIIDSTYNSKEPFTAFLIDVTGPVNFTGITVPAGLLLSGSHFESLTISTNGVGEIASIDLTGSAIDSDLIIKDVSMARFLAEGSSVGGSTTLKRVSIKQKLDLRNASIGFLNVDDNLEWPKDPQAFNLRGMTYSDIDLGDQGLTEETWKGLLQLVHQSAYSPQSYQALSQFLVDKGHPDWASEVQLAQRGRERSEILTPLSGSWFWSWFLFIFAGYGHRPVFAIFWSMLVIATGAFVFRRKEYMLPIEQDDVQVEYNPIWYSFALFLPYIDLGIASKWEPNPERKWARNYKYIHMIMGWVLAPIALLTFGGIIG
jgi:hypothetical protein